MLHDLIHIPLSLFPSLPSSLPFVAISKIHARSHDLPMLTLHTSAGLCLIHREAITAARPAESITANNAEITVWTSFLPSKLALDRYLRVSGSRLCPNTKRGKEREGWAWDTYTRTVRKYWLGEPFVRRMERRHENHVSDFPPSRRPSSTYGRPRRGRETWDGKNTPSRGGTKEDELVEKGERTGWRRRRRWRES